MLSKRQLATIAGSGLGVGVLGAFGIGSADAQASGQVGTSADPVDVFGQDIDVQGNLDVSNGSTTGLSSGNGLDTSKTIDVFSIDRNSTGQSFVDLFNGTTSKTVLSGNVFAPFETDYLYEFSGGQTFTRNSGVGGTSYSKGNGSRGKNPGNNRMESVSLPPASDVVRVAVGCDTLGQSFGASVIVQS
jgi:hypothetical protein